MKYLLVGLLTLASLPSFASTIRHENCNLSAGFENRDLNMILEAKGYTLYLGKIRPNTLNLRLDSDDEEYDSHPLSLTCVGQNETWAKFREYAYIERFDGNNFFTLAKGTTNYQACLQSGGDGKELRAVKRLLKKLPDCEIK